MRVAACVQSVESLTERAYLNTAAFIDRSSVSEYSCLYRSVETATVWSDAAALCCHHSFSHVAFGGRIVSYHITIFCVISYHIFCFLLRPHRAITSPYPVLNKADIKRILTLQNVSSVILQRSNQQRNA